MRYVVKRTICIISLVLLPGSYIGNVSAAQPAATPAQQQVRQAGKPEIGMTLEEAGATMTLVEAQVKSNGTVLQALFIGAAGVRYIVSFDGGTPNRIRMWSSYTAEEAEQFMKFRDTRPTPPLVLPPVKTP
jgi:hypothetical protein